MVYVVLSLLVALVLLVIAYLQHVYSYWERRGVPYERPLPLLGNLKGIGKTVHFRDVNERIYHRYKHSTPFVGMYFFLRRTAFIIDLDLIKHVLIKDFSNFHDRGIFNNVRDDPLTGHLLTLEGEQWRSMRTKLTPVFTSGKMKFMFSTIVKVAENLAKACGEEIATVADGVLEIKDLCARFTTDVIGTCAFGIECNSLKDPHAEFRRKGRMLLEKPRHNQLITAFLLTNPELARKLHLKFLPDEVSSFFLSVVRNTVQYRIENKVTRNDFMDMLVELKAQNEEAARHGDGIDLSQGLTIEQMAAQVLFFFVAGFETSSSTMSYALYELALNPDIQEKLRKEILSKLEKHGGELTYEVMNDMPYLEKVLAETLRKYTVLPHLIRTTVNDYAVPNTKHVIERGTNIIVPIDAIHHDPELYPEPTKFDPERFTPEAIQQRHPCAYMPFGDGPRNCIGMRFGKMQAKSGLISLLRHYTVSACDRTEMPITFNNAVFIIAAKNGIYLRIQRL